ncbi:MAG: c-type cytochrome [Acidobacteriaceae bacterium]|nr:c-type cytochrome [Acidobacteriaceae bacterium]MBV9223546.1 c-type cytochrome [Acidobacteriaceae bacterium]MBV9305452.1 c-type cytochrome [Acidobacteriaceae bacterium]MBV9679113.1 c-type cytochrome [Acidobacteriaceae bacterium]
MNIPKRFQNPSTLVSVVLLIAPFARAEERSVPPVIVIRYCSGCHGIDGKSKLPYIPRLASLNAEYIQRKIANFKAAATPPVDETFQRSSKDGFTPEGTAHMVGTAHALPEKDLQAAAQWYAAQQPAPGKSGKWQVMKEGKDLYINGLPSRHVPACQSCHGPEAQGTDKAPRLAGQNATYLLGQLALFRADNRKRSPMTEVARSLENEQARALAAYLQSH